MLLRGTLNRFSVSVEKKGMYLNLEGEAYSKLVYYLDLDIYLRKDFIITMKQDISDNA